MKIIRRPAFYLAAALTAGILSSYFLLSHNLILSLKILLITETIYLCFYTVFKLNISKKSIYTWLAILFLFLGSLLYSYQEYQYRSKYSLHNFADSGMSQLLAEIKLDPGDLESDKVYLQVYSVNGTRVKYGSAIITSEKLKRFNDGDLITLELELTKPAPALNPGSFSYVEYLKRKGVYLQGWNPENISLIRKNKSLKNLIIKVKKLLLNNINQLFTEDNAAFIKAILLGEKEYLSYEQESLLRNSGASHLLAISGLHMGILILTFSFILFKLCSKKRNALYLLSFLTFIYIILVGAAVSIIRAALLALLFLWSDEFNREGDFLNIISLTLIINLLLDPQALFTVSLQLSYILVLALFYLTPVLNRWLPGFLAVSLAAQLASLAITAYYFNEYAFIALVTNLWAIPYITVLLPLIFILLLLSLVSLNFFGSLAILIELGLKLLFNGFELMTLIQGRPLVIARPKLITIFIYYLFLFAIPFIYRKRYIWLKARKYKLWQKIVPISLLLIIAFLFYNPPPDNLEINFLAVGQGDGIFIQFPGGQNMLIDTGPPGKEGRNIEYSIISYLNYLGVSTVDYLMISHFDADHAGGLPHLLQRKKVKNIMIPPYHERTKLHHQLAEGLSEGNSKLYFLTAGVHFKIAGCSLEILNPESNRIKEDRNENSIVFLLRYRKNKFLFTGDLSKAGEARIVKDYNLDKIDVLKAGHHGSKTSSGEILLDAVRPELAVISVGRNNFGHPSAEVIRRFKRKSISYLRTDQRGMIKLISDGQNIYFNCFR
ncbi:competence protein ComEC [Halanaerobium saccharolyticum]|uniref:Competence protein ComEC n=1 Tax=Halanaerobium saccharolyticum TaxID=43595 RepID=A0A4V3CE94_9FIRM|nr:DNA internalization-related competence protein ComEC/Rec2 [Halanaerobium saccharolyticum]TDO85457.1 competence protein ComEC [Halanaerobium saccharolyticum]